MRRVALNPYLAKVRWLDTKASSSWETMDEVTIAEVEQWGWVVHHDSDELKLADTRLDGEWYGVTSIPSGCVVEVQKICQSTTT